MNIFERLTDAGNDMRLGRPFMDEAHRLRTMNAMAHLTGGKGFRTPPKEPRVRYDGKTRGDLKRAAREAANAKVSEERPEKFRHSSRSVQ